MIDVHLTWGATTVGLDRRLRPGLQSPEVNNVFQAYPVALCLVPSPLLVIPYSVWVHAWKSADAKHIWLCSTLRPCELFRYAEPERACVWWLRSSVKRAGEAWMACLTALIALSATHICTAMSRQLPPWAATAEAHYANFDGNRGATQRQSTITDELCT